MVTMEAHRGIWSPWKLTLSLDQGRGILRQLARVDPALPRLSLQSIFYRLYKRSVIWEYQNFRGTATRPGTADLTELTEDFNFHFPYINWRLLMRSYIVKLKRRARERHERRVQRYLVDIGINQLGDSPQRGLLKYTIDQPLMLTWNRSSV